MTQLRTGLRWGLGLLVAVGLVGMAGRAQAQDETLRAEPRTFGTSATTGHTLQAFAFTGFEAADISRMRSTGLAARFCIADCVLEAPLLLPAGARVVAIELDGCDDSALGRVIANLFQTGRLESGLSSLATAATDLLGFPGCVAVVNLAVPHTIDNLNNAYFVQVQIVGDSLDTRFQAVRVFYTLQVSPAPAIATFGDVPTSHPFFRFVEALARSGITSGCGGGNFCPDTPLTRGQMAVFLSLGLGLHFAP
jgi:hypothetical protein